MIILKKQIAIIEDDQSINQGIALTLGKEEYDFYQFYNLSDVKNVNQMDLLILDVNLPDGNGLEFLTEFRKTSQIPVLILTANDTEMDEVMGLQLGVYSEKENLKELITNISHQTKTPLTNILLYSQLLEEHADSDDIKTYADEIAIHAKKLDILIHSLS